MSRVGGLTDAISVETILNVVLGKKGEFETESPDTKGLAAVVIKRTRGWAGGSQRHPSLIKESMMELRCREEAAGALRGAEAAAPAKAADTDGRMLEDIQAAAPPDGRAETNKGRDNREGDRFEGGG